MSIGKYMKSQAGAIALMAIFLVFFISVLMITLEIMRRSDLETVTNQIRDMEAYYCAESGIEYLMNGLRNNPGWLSSAAYDTYTGTNQAEPCVWIPLKNPTYTSTRTWEYFADNAKGDTDYNYYNYVNITSTGTTTNYSRRVKTSYRRSIHAKNAKYQFITRWREL